MKQAVLFLSGLVSMVSSEVTLDKIDREILKQGLHRELVTHVTYTVTKARDFEHCSFVFRETVTKDMYIYYEEVTQEMPGFVNWPHHKPMNIEAPASISQDEEFIWRLPFSERDPANSSYLTAFETSPQHASTEQVPQTVTATIKYRFHYRYQPVKTDSSFTEVALVDPHVFIDCRDAHLFHFSKNKNYPITNLVNDQNRPAAVTALIANGRIEHRGAILTATVGLTLIYMVFIL